MFLLVFTGLNVFTGSLFCISFPFVFCVKAIEQKDREQKHITKELASFLTGLLLSTIPKQIFAPVPYCRKLLSEGLHVTM